MNLLMFEMNGLDFEIIYIHSVARLEGFLPRAKLWRGDGDVSSQKSTNNEEK